MREFTLCGCSGRATDNKTCARQKAISSHGFEEIWLHQNGAAWENICPEYTGVGRVLR